MPAPQSTPTSDGRFIQFLNRSGYEIPPYGLVVPLSDQFDEAGEAVLVVGRPTRDGDPNVLVNGPTSVPYTDGIDDSNYGELLCQSQLGVAFDGLDGWPKAGEFWGSAKDTFYAKKGKLGFCVQFDVENGTSPPVMMVTRDARETEFVRVTGERDENGDDVGYVQYYRRSTGMLYDGHLCRVRDFS